MSDAQSTNFQNAAEQASTFQKIWSESMSKLMQTAMTMSPNSAPPDIVRHIRSGIFQALAQSWEEFMRSPQFLEGTRQMMESAINFRKMSNDLLARSRNEIQAPSREDVDTIMLTVRHMEKRLLDRIEGLSESIKALSAKQQSRSKSALKKTKNRKGKAVQS